MTAQSGGYLMPEAARNVYVAELPTDFSDEELVIIFSSCGAIEAAKCMFDRETGKCRGYGFVLYVSAESAAQARRRFHKSILRGKQLTVRLSHPSATPNRDGSSGGLSAAASQVSSISSMPSFVSASQLPSPYGPSFPSPYASLAPMMQQGAIAFQTPGPQGACQIVFVQHPNGGQTFFQQPPQQQIAMMEAAPFFSLPTAYSYDPIALPSSSQDGGIVFVNHNCDS